MHGYFVTFLVLLLLAWVGGGIWFFLGPAKAAQRYVDELAGSITRRDDVVLFRQLYTNKQPRNVVLAWVLTAFLTPSISYIYSRQWVKCLLSAVTMEGLGIWWLVSIFSMPFEVMRVNKRLADAAYAELRLARPELFGGSGSLSPTTPQGLNPEALRQAGYHHAASASPQDAPAPHSQGQAGPAPAGSPDSASGTCPACGTTQTRASRFCGSCGTQLQPA